MRYSLAYSAAACLAHPFGSASLKSSYHVLGAACFAFTPLFVAFTIHADSQLVGSSFTRTAWDDCMT